jgi:hypothetical protein
MHKFLQLKIAPFGVSQVVMAGVLYGTMAQGNRNMLADHITSKMANHLQGKLIQVQASWSKIHGSPESYKSAYATTLLCKKEDYPEVCGTLFKLYGTDAANKDLTWPLLQFFPMSMSKSSASANDKFISRQLALERQLLLVIPRNLRNLQEVVIFQSDEEASFNTTVGEILLNITDHDGVYSMLWFRMGQDQMQLSWQVCKGMQESCIKQNITYFP